MSERPPPRGAGSFPTADGLVSVAGAGLLVVGFVLGLRTAHPVVRERPGGIVEVDPRSCGRVLTPRCEWRRESVVAATLTVAGAAVLLAAGAAARSRRATPQRVGSSIGPPEPLGIAGALVQVALPVFVVGLGVVLLTYHLQLMARLGGAPLVARTVRELLGGVDGAP